MKIVLTRAQILAARSIVRKAEANGDVPNPATVAIARNDITTLTEIAKNL